MSEKILQRAFDDWRNLDEDTGNTIEKAVRDKLGGTSDAPGMASAESIRKEAAE